MKELFNFDSKRGSQSHRSKSDTKLLKHYTFSKEIENLQLEHTSKQYDMNRDIL
jgi:hypothetical protein